MKKLLIVMFSLMCFSNSCREEGPNCHFKILIINQSSQDIMYGWNIKNTSGECYLSVSIIKPNETYKYTENNCWESALSNGQTTEFYIIDPNHYNSPGIFYDCALIEINNTILKQYTLTLDDLIKSNFTVIYQ